MELTQQQKQLRANIRNFLLLASLEELKKELTISLERGDGFRAEVIKELICEEELEVTNE